MILSGSAPLEGDTEEQGDFTGSVIFPGGENLKLILVTLALESDTRKIISL